MRGVGWPLGTLYAYVKYLGKREHLSCAFSSYCVMRNCHEHSSLGIAAGVILFLCGPSHNTWPARCGLTRATTKGTRKALVRTAYLHVWTTTTMTCHPLLPCPMLAFCASSFYYDSRNYRVHSSPGTSPCAAPSPCEPSRNTWPAPTAPTNATVGPQDSATTLNTPLSASTGGQVVIL